MAVRSIGQLTIDLIAKTFGFEQGMDKATRKAKSSGKEIEAALSASFRSVGGFIAGFVASLASVDVALRGFQQAVDAADRVDELSARFKISTETLSEWGYAAKMTGSDLEGLAAIIPKFSKSIADAADANSEAGKTFAALGISVRDQDGKLRSFQSLLPEVADVFKGLTNETTETALAMQLFGRSGAEFLEFLNLGSDGLSVFAARARELGIVIDSETAASAAEFKDRVDDLKAATQGLFVQISSNLLGSITDLTEQTTAFVKEGSNAKAIADSITGAFNFLANAATVTHATIQGVTYDIIALVNAAEAARKMTLYGGLDFSGASDLWQNAKTARELAAGESERIRRVFDNNPIKVAPKVVLIDPSDGFEEYKQQKALKSRVKESQRAIDALFNGKQGSKDSSSSREGDRLRQMYDSLAASLDKQIALFGKVSEEAKVRYEVEYGSLVNLEPKLKNYLIYKAEEYDAIKDLDDARKAADEEVRRQSQAFEQEQQRTKEFISDMEFEIKLMGLSNVERQKQIALRWANVDAMSEEGKKIQELAETEYWMREQVQVMDDMRDSFANFFEDVVGGTKSIKDAFSSMLDDIAQMITRRIAQNWVDKLFGDMGSTGGGSIGGNWFGQIAKWIIGGKANGGWTSAHSVYEVNERGLEMATVRGRDFLLTGGSPVEVTPNHRLAFGGGGGSVTQNFYNPVMSNLQTDSQRAREEARKAQKAMARNS